MNWAIRLLVRAILSLLFGAIGAAAIVAVNAVMLMIVGLDIDWRAMAGLAWLTGITITFCVAVMR